jgi:SAM-dependent methyltransferase
MSPPSPNASSSSSQPRVVRTVESSGEHYTFGDGATAADRLALLAAAFEPSSARLLRLLGYLRPRCAVDLGCGPGWSTRLVHALLAPAATLGLEQSPANVARAEATAPPGVAYRVHEVTDVPFPGEPPDFLYSRFLLTHLRDPEAALAAWAEAAADEAVLALEETAEIGCAHPAFVRYYQLCSELQAAYGQRLRIGATLSVPARSGWKAELDLLAPLSFPAARMARLHALNIETWKNDAFARAQFDAEEIDGLAVRLGAIARGAEAAPVVRVVMRQMILAKP